jgi:TatD DNase family protein
MEIVDEFKDNAPKAIFHCFSGNVEQAQQVVGLGNFKLGIGGVVTFKNSGLDKVVEAIDLKHLVLETDAPYLAPMPYRGKRNEPDYLVLIAKKIAEIKNISVEEVAAVTTQNSIDVFGC